MHNKEIPHCILHQILTRKRTPTAYMPICISHW